VDLFTKAQRQVEGWFKGELIYLFNKLCGQSEMHSWDCESLVNATSRGKCDFVVSLDTRVWLEVKALYHGLQRTSPIGLDIYLYKDSIGIWGDTVKLSSLKDSEAYHLLFIYPRPDPDRWKVLLDRYRLRVVPIELAESSRSTDYPRELYICKLRVQGPTHA
jgi:hypothetical protein